MEYLLSFWENEVIKGHIFVKTSKYIVMGCMEIEVNGPTQNFLHR